MSNWAIGIAQSSQQVLKSIKDMQVFLLWKSVAGMMMISPRVRALFQSYLFVLLYLYSSLIMTFIYGGKDPNLGT